jgi:hypothetical protein
MLRAAGVTAMDMSVGGWLINAVLSLPWLHPEIMRNISIGTNNVIGKRGVFVMAFPLNLFEFSTVISAIKSKLVGLAHGITTLLRDVAETLIFLRKSPCCRLRRYVSKLGR